uniref:Uncharacterized protein n=1 Tax=Romanomermis culicivorax TaxID=13658 RepID=A0A915KYE0_ROMCU
MDKSTDGAKINWLKIHSLKFEKEKNGIMQFSCSHEGHQHFAIPEKRPPICTNGITKTPWFDAKNSKG